MKIEEKEESLFNTFIMRQVEKMAAERSGRRSRPFVPVITVSIQPGSGGRVMAQRLAERFNFQFYNREIIQEVAKSIKIDPAVVEKIEKERLSGVEDLIASFVRDRYIWPGMYLEHLESIVQTIGEAGNAVIVGRGANFFLQPDQRFSVRVVAPLERRIHNVMKAFGASEAVARKRVANRQERRAAFIKKSFNADVEDPLHYDLVINTAHIHIDEAVDLLGMFIAKRYGIGPKARSVGPDGVLTGHE